MILKKGFSSTDDRAKGRHLSKSILRMENVFDVTIRPASRWERISNEIIFKIFSDFIWAKNASANGHNARRPSEVRTQTQTDCEIKILIPTRLASPEDLFRTA